MLRGSRPPESREAQDVAAQQLSSRSSRAGHQLVAGLKNYGANILSTFSHHYDGSLTRHPYFKLLRLYLEHYVPRPGSPAAAAAGVGASSSGRGGARGRDGAGSSGGGYGGYGGMLGGSGGVLGLGVGGNMGGGFGGGFVGGPEPTVAEVVWSVLIEFWLTDAAEPVPPEGPPSRSQSPTAAVAGVAAAGGGGFGGLGMSDPSGQGLLSLGGFSGLGGMTGGGLEYTQGVLGPLSSPTMSFGGGLSPNGMMGLAGGSVLNPAMMGVTGDPTQRLGSTGGAAPAATAAAGGPGAVAAAPGLVSPMQGFAPQPPAEELVIAVSHLARYVYIMEPGGPDQLPRPAQQGVAWLPASPVQVGAGGGEDCCRDTLTEAPTP